jgi:hypothetical protein
MSTQGSYQVIAAAPLGGLGAVKEVWLAISRAYPETEITSVQEFQREGICVRRSESLEQARNTALYLQELGADIRIIDPNGSVVVEGVGAPRVSRVTGPVPLPDWAALRRPSHITGPLSLEELAALEREEQDQVEALEAAQAAEAAGRKTPPETTDRGTPLAQSSEPLSTATPISWAPEDNRPKIEPGAAPRPPSASTPLPDTRTARRSTGPLPPVQPHRYRTTAKLDASKGVLTKTLAVLLLLGALAGAGVLIWRLMG